ncbi:MAG TPA: hypothetical protein VFJ53_02985 [Solirubrobacterales bacterium]|nr:hypothetical protein [Solirubrobacterales bacterium]
MTITATITATTAESSIDRIRNAATLISISLGVLSAFANQRANSVADQAGDLTGLTPGGVIWDLVVDCALALFGLALLIAASPLTEVAAEHATPLFHADTAFFALFCLLNVGIAVVFLWIVSTIVRRLIVLSKV